MQKHAITPPPEVVERLRKEAPHGIRDAGVTRELRLIAAAYQAGAEAAQDEIIHWLVTGPYGASIAASAPSLVTNLRAACCPKPPSLKEQALAVLQQLSESGYPANYQPGSTWDTIRRALNALPD